MLPAGSVQCAAGAAAGAEAAAADDEAVAAIAAVAAFVAAEAQQGPLLRAARLPGLPVALDGDEVPLAPLPIRRATANAQLPPAVLARTPHASELAAAVAARDPPRDTSDAAAAATMAAMMQPLALPGAPRLHTDARFLSCADLHRARSAWPVAAAPSPGAVRVVRVPSGMRHGMNFANKGAIGASDNGYDLRSGNSEQVSLVWLTAVLELPAAASLVRARLSYRYVVGASGNLSAIGPSFTLLARVLPATAAAARAGTGEDTDGLADAHVLHQSPMFPARPFHYDRCEGGAPTNYSPPTVVDAAVSAGVALPAGSRLAIGLLLRNAGRNFHLQAAGWGAPGGRGAADDLLGLELTLVETGASEPGGAAQQAEEEAAPSAAVVLAAVVGGAGAAGPDGAQGRRARLVEKWRAARRFARSLVCFA